MLSPYTFGVIGDGITDDTLAFRACLAAALAQGDGVTVPRSRPTGGPSLFKTSSTLSASGVDVIGEGSALHGATSGPTFPTFLPVAGSRVFTVGPRDATDVANGFTERAQFGKLAFDFSAAPVGCTGIGSDFGVSKRHFFDLHFRGLSGQVGAKQFGDIRLGGTSESQQISAYNTFERIHTLHCADALNFIGTQQQRYDDNQFSQCYVWNAHRSFGIIGCGNQLDASGFLSFDSAFVPSWPVDYTGHWTGGGMWIMALPYGAKYGLSGYSNRVNAFELDNVTAGRGAFFIYHQNSLGPIRNMDQYANSILSGGAPDLIQVLDNTDLPCGPQYTAGPNLYGDQSIRSGNIGSPQLAVNLIPNGRFLSRGAGNVPTRFSVVGAPTFDVWSPSQSPSFAFQSPNAIGLHAPSNPSGINGLTINLVPTYTDRQLRYLNSVCVGIWCFVTNAQGTADGVYVKVDDGVNVSEEIATLTYDGQTFGKLKQYGGNWHCVFVNHDFAHAMTKAQITVGLKQDASHAGTGYILVDHVFCLPGKRDAYTARAPLLPPALEALLV